MSEKKDRAVVEKLRRLSDDEDYLSQMLRHGLGHRTMLPAACVQRAVHRPQMLVHLLLSLRRLVLVVSMLALPCKR